MSAKLRKIHQALVVATLLITSSAPVPVLAQGGLASIFTSFCVKEGCSVIPGPTGAPVTLQYFLPKKSACSAPAVLLLHGSDGMIRYGEGYEEAAKGLASQGYAAFIVHYYQGAPGMPVPGPEDRDLPDRRAFLPWLATVNSAVSYISSLPCVDANRIGLLGFSLGGYLGATQASLDPRVKSVAILSAGMPMEFATKLRHMPPALIIHGDQDPDVPVAEAYRLANILAQHRWVHDLMILPGEVHLPYRCSKEIVAKRVLCWFDSTL